MTENLYNFFVLTDIPGQRVLHVSVSAGLQKNLTSAFRDQRMTFTADREEIEYRPAYHPEPDEIFKINPFDDLDDLLKITQSPSSLDSLEPDSTIYGHIVSFFSSSDSANELLFQNFDQRRIISNKGLAMIWDSSTFRQMREPGLSPGKNLGAILRGDELLFQKSWCARRIFDLTSYFKEATDEQLYEFLRHKHFTHHDSNSAHSQFDSWMRTKVCLILESGVLDKHNPEQLRIIAADLSYSLSIDSQGRIIFPQEKKQMKGLLRFLSEDYIRAF